MTLTPRHLLLAGLAIVGLTNVVALAGVAYNRSRAESTLRLSDREFVVRVGGYAFETHEDSSATVALTWNVRTVAEPGHESEFPMFDRYSMYFGDYYIPWLDKAKLESLGITARIPPEPFEQGRFELKELGRDVYLVLELGGAAYHAAVEDARVRAAAATAASEAKPDDAAARAAATRSDERARDQESKSTRLFVIDAGLDADALRRQYADPSRYAVVRGHVRPRVTWNTSAPRLTGLVTAIRAEDINVPSQFFRAAATNCVRSVDVNVGRRHEPWIEALVAGTCRSPAVSR